MDKRFSVPTRGMFAIVADILIRPLMWFVTPFGESPQLTHTWNNIRVKRSKAEHLEAYAMVACEGDPKARPRRRRLDILFHLGGLLPHIPLFSIYGWSRYIVIEPVDWKGDWYIGWITADSAGASQIPIRDQVRMLIGPENVAFFGVRSTNFEQIKLREAGRGKLGDGGPFREVPLH